MPLYDAGGASEEEGEIVEDEVTKAEIKTVLAATKPVPVEEKVPVKQDHRIQDVPKEKKNARPIQESSQSDAKRRRTEGKPSDIAEKDSKKPHDVYTPAEKKKELSIILREPYQVRKSDVLLNFNHWFDAALKFTWPPRISTDDLQTIMLNLFDPENVAPSQVVEEWDDDTRPSKLCVVLAKGVHPDVLSKQITSKSTEPKLSFFQSCSTLPCSLSTTAAMERNAKIKETPLPQLLSRFPSRNADLDYISPESLFTSRLELTILANYTNDQGSGWSDELILHPSGYFFRKTTNQNGDWRIDGDLLHLRWTITQPDAVDKDAEATVTSMDVLQAEDDSMRRFRTSDQLDATYTLPDITGNGKPRPKRQLRLTVLRAAQVLHDHAEVSLDTISSEWTTPQPIEYYILSDADRAAHQYPMDVYVEQEALLKSSQGKSPDKFVTTSNLPASTETHVLAVDCEMCETALGSELTRVTLVDASGAIVYDQLVKPLHTILNYHTEFSGITAETLEAVDMTLADVQQVLLEKYLKSNTILVGHSIDSDLRALRLVHATIVDTAILYPHARGFPFKPSLKQLTSTYLGRSIQTSDMQGHDSGQDALAALHLFQLKVERGPQFGLPAPPNESQAYMTIADKCATQRLGFYELRPTTIAKPWTLYSSGEWGDLLASTFLHVRTNERCSVAPPVHTIDDVVKQVQAQAQEQDIVWIELDYSKGPMTYIETNHIWKRHQDETIQELDTGLSSLAATLPPKTLMLVVPQGDLGIFRRMRGVRLKSRWGDGWESQWSSNDQLLLQYALCGALDSVAFFKTTR
ncbi:hypothetical protein AC1031_011683 [Aphanomyces cochlioides]|nr:hypothetical protein AC1031_011683 [Aphanomyces cochlioides]